MVEIELPQRNKISNKRESGYKVATVLMRLKGDMQ